MSEAKPNSYPEASALNAWSLRLDKHERRLWRSGRFRILMLLTAVFSLLALNLVMAVAPGTTIVLWLQGLALWINGLALLLLLLLFWSIWRELLEPLLGLCRWAELMRGVNLDARVSLNKDSDFSELGDDINMLGNMINQLSHETEIQLERHTDYISRESRSLATLYQVTSSINLSHDLNELFEKLLESLSSNLHASAGIIRLFKTRTKQEILVSQGNFNHTFLASVDRFLPIHDADAKNEAGKAYRIDSLKNSTVFVAGTATSQEKLPVLSILIMYRKAVRGAVHLFFPDNITLALENYDDLLLSIGQHLGSAIERFRLIEEESALLVIQERTRLSHELHDSLAQTIASLRIQIRVIDETFHAGDEKGIWQQMERIEYTIDQANDQLRELIAHFRVPMNEQGLIPSIEEAISRTKAETGISIYFQNEWPQHDFSTDLELNLLRIVQECLANIRKHSQAEVVRVMLVVRDGKYILLVEDDGVGFDETAIKPEAGLRLGLRILRDRAQQIDAGIEIESEPGEGTRVQVEFSPATQSARLLAG